MATFLLEIGTEELPADFARLALPQLESRLREDLATARLPHGVIRTTGTPRRLAVQVEGLPTRQEDAHQEHKGPPAQQAFRDGSPTPAAVGFARRCGLPVERLEIRETSKGPFVFARTLEAGRTTADVLAELIPGWLWALQGRRFMRWGLGESRFSRPVRWLLALLDEAILPVRLPDCDPPIASGRLSRGHRLHPEPVAISSAEAYASTLAAAGVLVDRQARGEAIRAQLAAAAAKDGARLDLPEALLEELVDLVEQPWVIEGSIDAAYLSLPAEVLSTVMRAHQRYVPLLTSQGSPDPLALSAEGVLVPRFLCVSNALPEAETSVRRGNERVLRARLADAVFFVKADQAVASIDRREALSRVTFAEGLGSLRDRTERLEWCTDVLLRALNVPEAAAQSSRRAAHLCKHDLVSQMVGEFPELQGLMGAKYLLGEGESRDVALAVLEHYLPRGAVDELPESIAGSVLALAERFELLLSIFSRGERPSGSSDPYGLRRAGNGLLQILWKQHWPLDADHFLRRSAQQWQSLFPDAILKAEELSTTLAEFLHQRFISLLIDEGVDQDIVQAVAGEDNGDPRRVIRDVCDAKERVSLLQRLRKEGRLSAIQAVVQRATRLADKGSLPRNVLTADQVVNPALFERESEARLLQVLQMLSHVVAHKSPYFELAMFLEESKESMNAFFDGPESVRVICDDLEKRQNRLNLLGVFRNQAEVLADFKRLEN